MNLSARLMAAAQKHSRSILTDEATFKGANKTFEFATLPPIHVKGKDLPQAVFQPTAKRAYANEATKVSIT